MAVAASLLVLALSISPLAAPGGGGTPAPTGLAGQEQLPLAEVLLVEPGGTCLDPAQLLARVVEFRGDTAVDARLGIHVVGAERPTVVRFEVVWAGKTVAVRDFDPPPEDCEDLHAVVGVALAIALDEDSLAEAIAIDEDSVTETIAGGSEPEPELEPEPKPAPVPGPAVASAEATLPVPGSRTRLSIGIAGLLLVGVIPRVAGGASVGLEVGPREWLDVRMTALASFAIDREFAGGLLDFGLGGGQVDVCGGGPARWRVRPRGCVGFTANAIRWVGRGFDVSEAGVAPWLAVTAGGDLRIALTPRIGLQLSAAAAIPVLKSDYALNQADGRRTLRSPDVGAFVGLGPIFRVL